MKRLLKNKEILMVLAIIGLAVISVNAQNPSMTQLRDEANAGIDLGKTIAKAALSLIGLIGAGMTAWNVNQGGGGPSTKHIISFVVSIIIIAVGLTLFD